MITQPDESAEIEPKNLLEKNLVEGIIISQTKCEVNRKYYENIMKYGTPIVFFKPPLIDEFL